MDKNELQNFLIAARENTYAGAKGKVEPLLQGSTQLEYGQGDYLYRDIYNMGNKIFIGLETIYFKDNPVWSMSYFGNFQKMTEEEVDDLLRGALIEHKEKARLWYQVEWQKDDYRYVCIPRGDANIEEMSGIEEIFNGEEKLYYFYYWGGLLFDPTSS